MFFSEIVEEIIMKKLLCLTVVTLGSIASAVAQTSGATSGSDRNATAPATPPSSQGVFETLDKNSDAKISMDEAKASSTVSTSFQTADKNSDGALSKMEFSSFFGL